MRGGWGEEVDRRGEGRVVQSEEEWWSWGGFIKRDLNMTMTADGSEFLLNGLAAQKQPCQENKPWTDEQ